MIPKLPLRIVPSSWPRHVDSIVDADGEIVISDPHDLNKFDYEFTELLVRAVNNHQEITEFLEAFRSSAGDLKGALQSIDELQAKLDRLLGLHPKPTKPTTIQALVEVCKELMENCESEGIGAASIRKAEAAIAQAEGQP